MERIFVSFHNKRYHCTLFSSRERYPFFYWCYFEDEDLVKEVGDCVGFVEKEGSIATTESYGPKYKQMVEQIQHCILQHYYPKA